MTGDGNLHRVRDSPTPLGAPRRKELKMSLRGTGQKRMEKKIKNKKSPSVALEECGLR